jgi:preprotein translocase subunit SecE
VARDRKRAKQRRAQRGAPSRTTGQPTDRGSVRADLPGALEHAGDVDEFDAALIRGAGGVPVTPEESLATLGDDADEDANGAGSETALLDTAADGGRRGGGITPPTDRDSEDALPSAPRERRQPLPRRAVSFLRASWAELQRVQWPNRTQVSQATAVVLGFVAIAGAYLGAADWVAQKIVNLIL